MNLQAILFEPTSPTLGEVSRFLHLTDSEGTGVEGTRFVFASRRHCELNMVKALHGHGSSFLLRNSGVSCGCGEPPSFELCAI